MLPRRHPHLQHPRSVRPGLVPSHRVLPGETVVMEGPSRTPAGVMASTSNSAPLLSGVPTTCATMITVTSMGTRQRAGHG
jgi:hypothetical protein